MNKKYMDFVPAKSGRKTMNHSGRAASKAKPELVYPSSRPERVVTKGLSSTRKRMNTVPRQVESGHMDEGGLVRKKLSTRKTDAPTLGVVEDLNSRFVENDLPKRPLGSARQVKANKNDSRLAKLKRFDKKISKPVEKPVETTNISGNKATFVPPKSPFINMEKVTKRPLSRNVYQKKIEPPKEEPKGPVTIISKPEKDSRIGLVVVVILTIILGAAAGTVAFLLLPK